MAFEKWGKFNRETSVPLTFEYTREAVTFNPSSGYPITFKYTRRATKSFVYKGMSEAVAKACASAMRRRYTRRFVVWFQRDAYYYPRNTHYDKWVPVANVNVVKREVVYDVQVTIDESVSIYMTERYDIGNERSENMLERQFLYGSHGIGGDRYTRIHGFYLYDED